MDFESSQDVVTSLGDKAAAKTQLSFIRLSILGIMAGFFIALGYLSFIRISGTMPKSWGGFSTFLGGCLFPIGLVALTFVSGELATGNMMVMTLGVLQKKINSKELLYNWLIVLLTNCIGGFLVAYFFGHVVGLTEGAFLEKTISVAQAKIADPPLVAFISGIGCNIFVCLAVYLGAMGKTYLGKMFGLWFPVMVFVVCGFQHVVANAFIIPAAIFSNASGIQWSDYLVNTVFVFLGNAVGGSLFLAVPLMFVTAKKRKRVSLMVFTKSIEVHNMIQIGSTGRNSGKTAMAKKVIAENYQRFTIYGLKIITISGARGKCQRGETGCGICTSIDEGYELIEESNSVGSKDTMQLLKAGCKKVYLLKVFHDHLLEGFLTFLQYVPRDTLIVCESNSIREVVKPGLFVMMNNQKSVKKTAAKVIDQADIILETPKLVRSFNLIKTKNGVRFSENDVENRREKV